MPMTQTPAAARGIDGAGDRPARRRRLRPLPNMPISELATPPLKPFFCCATCSAFKMSNFTIHLVVFNLPFVITLRASSGSPAPIGQLNFVQHRTEVGAIEHLEIGLGQFELGEIGNVVGAEFLPKVALLLLISPGSTISCGPVLGGVGVVDVRVHGLVGGAFASFDTPLLAVGDGLESAPQVGGDCAQPMSGPRTENRAPIFATRLEWHKNLP